ncbi:MAG: N-acetyl sugar amidotransferase [Prochlorococcus marinus CUG1430]|nr:N-acetyl sugar amidotransferase [Prochlorococcus marinus CUG1430]
MDTSDPATKFDSNGISNHYWDFHNIVKAHWYRGKKGEKQLEKKIEEIKERGKGKEFDSILGLSGGLDSSYMLHTVVSKYKLRPLVFHVDGGWNTEIAVNNIKSLVENLKLDLFTEVIDWNEMKNFQLAMFKSGVPHLDVPQDMAFVGTLYKFAEKYNVKTILNGGNIATESVLRPFNLIYYGADLTQAKDIIKKFGNLDMKTYPFTSVFYHKVWLKYIKNVNVFKPLNYINYLKSDAIRELKSIYGWKPYSQKHFESRFTRFYEGYWLTNRFNYDMRRVELSSMILSEQIHRSEAIEILKNPPLESKVVEDEFNYVATKLDISVEELEKYFTMPKKYYWDYKNNKKLLKLGENFLKVIGGARRGGSY